MVDVLRKVEKLIALGAGSDEHEARNADRQACELIRKHRIVLAMPPVPEVADVPDGPQAPPPGWMRPGPEVTEIVTRAAGRVVSSVLRDLIRGAGR